MCSEWLQIAAHSLAVWELQSLCFVLKTGADSLVVFVPALLRTEEIYLFSVLKKAVGAPAVSTRCDMGVPLVPKL